MRKGNEELQKDVEDAIKWKPLLKASEIGVSSEDGVITLTGIVDCYIKKMEAENIAKSVTGVKAVVEKIEVQYANMGKKDDSEIANGILIAFRWNWEVPNDKVRIQVEEGWITLEGELQWNYQKEAVIRSVCNLIGVKGITNNITIKEEALGTIEKNDIERALARNWSIDVKDIQVIVSGNIVTLNGTVHSLYQKDEAERIASYARGVWTVYNELVIEFKE